MLPPRRNGRGLRELLIHEVREAHEERESVNREQKNSGQKSVVSGRRDGDRVLSAESRVAFRRSRFADGLWDLRFPRESADLLLLALSPLLFALRWRPLDLRFLSESASNCETRNAEENFSKIEFCDSSPASDVPRPRRFSTPPHVSPSSTGKSHPHRISGSPQIRRGFDYHNPRCKPIRRSTLP